jgi:hypothetical protein
MNIFTLDRIQEGASCGATIRSNRYTFLQRSKSTGKLVLWHHSYRHLPAFR